MSIDDTIEWLLQGDPAIRWQLMHDLPGEIERNAARERQKVAREGWGGAPSRWNTLRALRVLKWWAGGNVARHASRS